MSWYEVYHKDKGLATGIDHIFGLFMQIWKVPEDVNEQLLQKKFGVNPDEIIADIDTQRGGTIEEMIKVAVSHGFLKEEVDFGDNATLKEFYANLL